MGVIGNLEIAKFFKIFSFTKKTGLAILPVVHWKTSTAHTESNSTTYGLYVLVKTKMQELATLQLRKQLRRQEQKQKPKQQKLLQEDNFILETINENKK